MTTTDEIMIDVPEYITDLSRRGRTRGLAELHSEGRALKNPHPILGETYVLWSESALDDGSPVFIATYCGVYGGDGERLFATFAYVLQPVDETGSPEIRTTTSQHAIEDKVWVKARFDVVPLTDDQMDSSVERMQELRRELTAEQAWFSEFSDGLNELAERHGWCGQYDDIVRDLGMPGRERDYWVEVQAGCTVTDNNPSGRLDTLLEEHYGAAFETTRVEMTGKVTVRINGITAAGSDDAQNHVNRDDVKRALDDMFSGNVELDDWEVEDSGEED